MSTDEKLLIAVKEAMRLTVQAEMLQLKRKLKRAQSQRDEWKYKANHYRSKLLERGTSV